MMRTGQAGADPPGLSAGSAPFLRAALTRECVLAANPGLSFTSHMAVMGQWPFPARRARPPRCNVQRGAGVLFNERLTVMIRDHYVRCLDSDNE